MFQAANNAFDISTLPQSLALQFDLTTPSWSDSPFLKTEKNFLASGMQGGVQNYPYLWEREAGMRGLGCTACGMGPYPWEKGSPGMGDTNYFANQAYRNQGLTLKSGMNLGLRGLGGIGCIPTLLLLGAGYFLYKKYR